MIVQTSFKLEEDGWELIRTYSSRGMKILQEGTGEIYDEAIDPAFTNRSYVETNIPIESVINTDDEGEIIIEPESDLNIN